MKLNGLQKGFGAGPEKGCESPSYEVVFLIQHVPQDRDKASSAAVIKFMWFFFLAFIARHQVSNGREINKHLRSHRVTVWWQKPCGMFCNTAKYLCGAVACHYAVAVKHMGNSGRLSW